jgi:hypothetical protein
MAYWRFSDGRGLLSARHISIKLVLPFIFNSGGRLRDCRLNKDSLGSRGSIRGRSDVCFNEYSQAHESLAI